MVLFISPPSPVLPCARAKYIVAKHKLTRLLVGSSCQWRVPTRGALIPSSASSDTYCLALQSILCHEGFEPQIHKRILVLQTPFPRVSQRQKYPKVLVGAGGRVCPRPLTHYLGSLLDIIVKLLIVLVSMTHAEVILCTMAAGLHRGAGMQCL
jgi:hypothetical protein